jgi:putative transcriptional regulator
MGRTKQETPTVTNIVRELRVQRGLSQAHLAEAAGVSRQTINSIETGRYVPSLPLAILLAQFFDESVERIFHVEQP